MVSDSRPRTVFRTGVFQLWPCRDLVISHGWSLYSHAIPMYKSRKSRGYVLRRWAAHSRWLGPAVSRFSRAPIRSQLKGKLESVCQHLWVGSIKELFATCGQSANLALAGGRPGPALSLSGLVPPPEQMKSEGTVAKPVGTTYFCMERRMARPYSSPLLRGEHGSVKRNQPQYHEHITVYSDVMVSVYKIYINSPLRACRIQPVLWSELLRLIIHCKCLLDKCCGLSFIAHDESQSWAVTVLNHMKSLNK